jgi:hypothetical protein
MADKPDPKADDSYSEEEAARRRVKCIIPNVFVPSTAYLILSSVAAKPWRVSNDARS